MTTPTQIRIDTDIKKEASILFAKLGLDMSTAVNIFLHQCLIKGGLPFNIELNDYKRETLEAMKEAKEISRDKNVKGYNSIDELNKALEED